MPTKIAWADETWNPIVGCSKVSPGCLNCYAEKMAVRLAATGQEKYKAVVEGGKWSGKTFSFDRQEYQSEPPYKWTKPRRIFVCSMGDLFHESVPHLDINFVFRIMERNARHTFLLLTKRPDRMKDFIETRYENVGHCIPKNIWLGVTAENQEQADKRIPVLLQIPAAVHFVSIEPMLEAVDISRYMDGPGTDCSSKYCNHGFVNQVIVGCESGPHARPMNLDWVRSIRDQCSEANAPFFFKQAMIDGKLVHIPLLDGVRHAGTPGGEE